MTLSIERHPAGVVSVTIDRPEKANTIDETMHLDLARVWFDIERDADIRAIVLTGRGSVFCGGGDEAGWATLVRSRSDRRRKMSEARSIVVNMLRCEVPIVAAVNGPAIGLGFSLVLACDIIVMCEGSYLVDPHVGLGLVAGDGGAALLPELVPLSLARQVLLTGRRLAAAEAEAVRLASAVVPPSELFPHALAVATELAAHPVDSMRDTKRAINLALLQRILGPLEMASAAEAGSFDGERFGAITSHDEVGHPSMTSTDTSTPLIER